jgi:hypothetical protein
LCAQRAQCPYRGARCRRRVHEGGKERVTLDSIDEASLRRDCPTDERMPGKRLASLQFFIHG